ncbi:MAG: hypothetical protein H0W90_16475 [Actinobacteria bacterium]|nr:hypothetical protein [Actinomycetota bacterium]
MGEPLRFDTEDLATILGEVTVEGQLLNTRRKDVSDVRDGRCDVDALHAQDPTPLSKSDAAKDPTEVIRRYETLSLL